MNQRGYQVDWCRDVISTYINVESTLSVCWVINIYCKYELFAPSNDKKVFTITNSSQEILDKSHCKPNKIWVNKGSEFHNRSVKSSLQDSDINIYSTHNEGKYVVAEIFIWTLKNKIYEHITSVSKKIYIDKLDNIVKKQQGNITGQ